MELVFQAGQATKGNSAGPYAVTANSWPTNWDGASDWWIFDGGYKSYALTLDSCYYYNASTSSTYTGSLGAVGTAKRVFRTWGLGASLDSTLSWSSDSPLIIGGGRDRDTISTSHILFTPRSISGIRVYSCTIWEGEDCVRHYIPCTSPDGVYGMYDAVNGKFLVFRRANPLTISQRVVESSLPPAFGGGTFSQTFTKFVAASPVTSALTIKITEYLGGETSFTIAKGATVSNEVVWERGEYAPTYSISKASDDFFYYMDPILWSYRSIIL